MADTTARIRGLIYEESAKRRSERLLYDDGLPNCEAIAQKMGMTRQSVWRYMGGRIEKRRNVERRRSDDYDPSPQLIRGLGLWLNLSREDVWVAIADADPIPPFKLPRGRR